jgi:hypothetical protein
MRRASRAGNNPKLLRLQESEPHRRRLAQEQTLSSARVSKADGRPAGDSEPRRHLWRAGAAHFSTESAGYIVSIAPDIIAQLNVVYPS